MAAIVSDARLRPRLQTYSKSGLWLIAVCFIFSGATGLIYEVLWARMLGLVFGATTFAISAVLAAFMGGLALGSAWAGRLAARIKKPLRAYALLEVGVALYALAVPFLFHSIDGVYAFIWTHFHPGFYAFSLWRFVLSCAVLLIPTTLMGATLPVLTAALVRSSKETRNSIARLYTCNLVGAILGTILAGFFLLPELGIRATIYTAAIINILIGLAAFFIDRQDAGALTMDAGDEHATLNASSAMDKTATQLDAQAASDENSRERAILERDDLTHKREGIADVLKIDSQKFWLLAAFISGFVTISTQVAWTRVLTMVIGSSTYAFSIVVALFLLGLSSGAYIISTQKQNVNLRRTVRNVEVATAITLFLSLWITNRTPGLLIEIGTGMQLGSWLGLLALQILIAALLILFPAVLMGMVMPLVLVWAGKAGESASVRLVGRSYAVNTLGAIVGAFSTGFILIPKIDTRFTILFAAALCIMLAGIAYKPARADGDVGLHRSLAVGATVALILILFTVGRMMSLNLGDLSKGAYDLLVRLRANPQFSQGETSERKYSAETNRLLMYKEGPTATVSVREDWGVRSMAINGRTNASDKDDMPTQVMLGQLPLLLAPRMERALIVGYGSGVSVGALLESPLKSLECLELEPEVVSAASYFNHVNHEPLKDARLKLIIDDARTYLHVNPTQYDIIVSEPSHPWVPGVANLFTQEFFELGRSRLKDDGVFAQWVQIYQLSPESLRSVLATFLKVFPHARVFRVGGAAQGKDLILVGSRSPLPLERMNARRSEPRMAAELARINLQDEASIASWYVCDETQLAPAVTGAIINTDDNMRVETRAPREAFLPLMDKNAAWIEMLAQQAEAARLIAGN
jgi:spermidine synthase